MQLLAATELPDVVGGYKRGMSLIFLPWVDRVSEVGEIGVAEFAAKIATSPGTYEKP